MKIDGMKPLGAFVENTIRPLIGEFSDLIYEFQRQGLPLTEENLTRFMTHTAKLHLRTVIIQAIRDIIIAIIIAGVLWKTSV